MRITTSASLPLLAGLTVCATALPAAATEWELERAASNVTMYTTKQGAWFNGVFEQFSASIEFDLDAPADGHIVGIVETGTIATGDPQNDDYVMAYLDSMQFPEGRFESTSIETTADGYRAVGELTLKGETRPAALDFVFAEDDGTPTATGASFSGRMVVDRFDFDIASDVDTSWTGQEVTVIIELRLTR